MSQRATLALMAVVLLVVSLTGCTSRTTTPPTAAPTVTAAVEATPSTSSGSTPSTSPVSSPLPTPALPTSSSSPSGAIAADPGRPQGQCADALLTVALDSDKGAAGTLHATVVFTNTGASSCVLRGAPGISVVGHGNGTQIGVPAARNQSNARVITLAGRGGQAHANLTIGDIRHAVYAPAGCDTVVGDGYRIYPPHSIRAYFIRENEVYACSGTPVFLHVGVVTSGR